MAVTQILLLIVAVIVASEANSPGFKARITNKGLKYASSQAMDALKKSVEKIRIPNQSGKASGFKYEVKNIQVTSFTPPTSSIQTDPGHGLVWKATGANLDMKGDFSYRKWFVKDSGSFTCDFSKVYFNLGFAISRDSSGHPTLVIQQCTSNVGDVSFKFHGGLEWLYNLFRHQVGDAIKKLLNSQMCQLITKEVNVDGAKKLSKLKLKTKLGKDYLLDYSLVKTPVFTSTYLETFHKGEIYWETSPKEAPLSAPKLPDMADKDHMMFLWVSDYMANTMMYNAQKYGALKYNLTRNDISPDQRGVLNTSCPGLIPKCLGRLIPMISQKYPNTDIELRMNSSRTPKLAISSSGVAMTFAGIIDLYANLKDKPAAFLVSLNADMSMTMNVSVSNELLYAHISDLSVKLKTIKSMVGPVSDTSLNFIVKEVLNIFLIPKLNGLGQKGFPLPMTNDFKFQNTKLVLAQDSIILATDIQYTPQEDDHTLRFKPTHRN